MLIKRKHYSYPENLNGASYSPAQVTGYVGNQADYMVGKLNGTLDLVDQSKIGQVQPVKRKTRMVRNAITGLKAYVLPKKKNKQLNTSYKKKFDNK
jgi:hypothetical protein